MRPHLSLHFAATLVFVVLSKSLCVAATPAVEFEDPIPLTSNGTNINLGNHSAPRLVDWNSDGRLDLLVGAGDGYIWIFMQATSSNSPNFQAGQKVQASGVPIRVGTGYTGVCFADMNGDGRPDLVAAGNDNLVRYFPNIGIASAPAFSNSVVIQGTNGALTLPSGVNGRIDIADWDGDGLFDLLTGDFDGTLKFYRNTGNSNAPIFGLPPIQFKRASIAINEPYNVHPRAFDLNHDGVLDLTYGINWGYFKFLVNHGGAGATHFSSDHVASNTNGTQLNVRSLVQDDSIPDFADLNGDGVLDLITGGLNGKLFWMPGVRYTRDLDRIEAIMAAHTNDLGSVLAANSSLRDELFGLHQNVRRLAADFLPMADRSALRDWYVGHIGRYSQYLRRQYLNPAQNLYVPYLAGQVWVNLFESLPDLPYDRRIAASACGFTGTMSNLMVNLGVIYVENASSTATSQQAVYDIAASIPSQLQIVELITEAQFLQGPNGSGAGSIQARTGVNVFAQVGDYSEGFPPEVPPTLIDGFCVVVAHELNHNVEHAAGQIYPWYWDRKFDLLEQSSPPDVIFKDHNSVGFGIDLPATQARFLSRGFWDGNANTWTSAYNAYWSTGPGQGFDRHWLRDNLRFCLDNPQEAFATLANQYFTSSDVMLQLAVSRWVEGITNCINQFLFFADVYALGSNSTWFYRIDTAANVTRTAIPVQRDANGHICGFSAGANRCDFALDADGNVSAIFVNSVKKPTLFDGLLAYYPFNGNANDESGNGRHGIVLGATLAEDRFGRDSNAYHFDDIDDGIRVGSISVTGRLTIAAWIFKEGDSSTHDQIVCITNAGGVYLSIFPNSNPSLKNHVDFGANYNPADRYFSTNPVPVNAWVHIAATYDGQQVRLYQNGSLIQEASRNGGFSSGRMYIGRDGPGAATDVFRGVIDDVRIYNRALGQSEVADLFSAEVTLPRPSISQPVITTDKRFSVLIAGGEVGRLYRVQASTNLSLWSDVTNFVSTITAWQFIDPFFTNYSRRFYRVVCQGWLSPLFFRFRLHGPRTLSA